MKKLKPLGKITFPLFLLLILIIFSSCHKKQEASPVSAAQETRPKVEARLVRVIEVKPVRITERLELPGTLQAENVANILSTAEGKISRLFKKEGDRVRQDEVVALISSLVREDIINSARLILEEKRRAWNEAPDDENLKKQYLLAERDYEFAQQQYKEIPVTSPISGVVSQRWVDLGDMVPARARLFEIQSSDRLRVDVPVSELDLGRLSLNMPSSVRADACPGRIFNGRIQRIHPLVDNKTRNGLVEIVLDDICPSLKAGMFVRVTFILRTIDGALAVPAPAIIERPGFKAVFVVNENKAEERAVMTGLETEGLVQILSGLGEGERVVVEGQEQLKTGMPVKVMPSAEQSGS